MRIVSGMYRGRTLAGPKGMNIRPTSDRLKETLFDILGWEVGGSIFLDLFAGTGAIGLEAISRGAKEVIFVESSDEGCRLIRKNLDLCGVAEGYRLLEQDIFPSLRQLGREAVRADMVYMDPPYGWRPYGDLLDILYRSGVARENARVVIEHHKRSPVPSDGTGYRRIRISTQGNKCLSFYAADSGQHQPEGSLP
jgi:16S rRNA (guanine(966)-N(2))-methyltransferase RsmD